MLADLAGVETGACHMRRSRRLGGVREAVTALVRGSQGGAVPHVGAPDEAGRMAGALEAQRAAFVGTTAAAIPW